MPSPPVVGFAAYSGSGKTTLARRVIELLSARGVRLGVVKHAHHDFDVDQPGKDSYALRKAGAAQMLVSSRRHRALVTEVGSAPEPTLEELVTELDTTLDLILVEGFKYAEFPKIEVRRVGVDAPELAPSDPNIIAIVTDAHPDTTVSAGLPVLDLNAPEHVADFIVSRFLPAFRTA